MTLERPGLVRSATLCLHSMARSGTNGQPRNTTCIRHDERFQNLVPSSLVFQSTRPMEHDCSKPSIANKLCAERAKTHRESSGERARTSTWLRVHDRCKRLPQRYHSPPCVPPPKPFPCPERKLFSEPSIQRVVTEGDPALADSGFGVALCRRRSHVFAANSRSRRNIRPLGRFPSENRWPPVVLRRVLRILRAFSFSSGGDCILFSQPRSPYGLLPPGDMHGREIPGQYR